MDSTVKLFFALIILELLTFALPTFFFCKMKGDDYLKELSLEPFSWKLSPFLIAISAVMLAAGLVINALFFFWGIGSSSYTSLGSFILSDVSLDRNPLYVFFAYGALPALCEEFLFRGVVLYEYRKYSFTTAAIVSSFAYALCYFDLSAFPFYFLSGMLLAFTVRMTGSVFAAMITRFVVNVASIYLMPPLWTFLTQPLGVLFAFFVTVALFIICLTFALRETERRYRSMAYDAAYAADSPYPIKRSLYNAFQALTAPSFLLCLVTYIATLIVTALID